MQVSMDRPGVYWKLLVLVALDRKGNDTSAHELLSLGSCDDKCFMVPTIFDKNMVSNPLPSHQFMREGRDFGIDVKRGSWKKFKRGNLNNFLGVTNFVFHYILIYLLGMKNKNWNYWGEIPEIFPNCLITKSLLPNLNGSFMGVRKFNNGGGNSICLFYKNEKFINWFTVIYCYLHIVCICLRLLSQFEHCGNILEFFSL